MNTLHSFCQVRRNYSSKIAALGAVAVAAAIAAPKLQAAPFVLQNGNSTVTIDPASASGVEKWTVNGQNELNQEWFWVSLGNNKPISLDQLGTPTVKLMSDSGSGNNDIAKLTYGPSNGLQITLTYSLDGGQTGSTTSDLTDSISITNTSNQSENLHLYEYANFNLGGSTSGQSVAITNSNKATDTGSGVTVQTVVSPKASHYEANTAPNLLNELNGGSAYTLSDASTSHGDGEWAFQWNDTLSNSGCGGGSFNVETDQKLSGQGTPVLPEAKSSALALAAGSMLLLRRRRTAVEI